MRKIIIKNETNISDIDVLTLVLMIMEKGRISKNKKQYIYLSCFEINNIEYHIVTHLRKGTDIFTIYEVGEKYRGIFNVNK